MDHNHNAPLRDHGPNGTEHPRPTPTTAEQPSNASEWDRIKQHSAELLDFFSYYLEARTDIFKAQGRQFLFRLRLEIAGILVVAGALVVAITLIVIGVAQGLAQIFADKPWLGPLITGLALLGTVSLAVWWWVVGTRQTAYNRMVDKYEQRKSHQRARFGHDVAGRAAAARAEPRTGVSDPPSR